MSEQQDAAAPSAGHPRPPWRRRSPWRRQAGVLGTAFAVAAVLLATWLALEPPATSYSGLPAWVVFALLAFVLVLGGACVLFAASLPATRRVAPSPVAAPPAPPVPQAFPDGSYPEPGPADSPAGAFAQPAVPPALEPAPPAAAGDVEDTADAGRPLTVLGALIGTAGLALATIAVALAALLPTATESIRVQFTDLYGRVQLEYCPTLPASFAATASHDDLAGSATILPVRISAETCGNSDYVDGVWLYLNRTSITVSDRP